jgi:hypothetical protein
MRGRGQGCRGGADSAVVSRLRPMTRSAACRRLAARRRSLLCCQRQAMAIQACRVMMNHVIGAANDQDVGVVYHTAAAVRLLTSEGHPSG